MEQQKRKKKSTKRHKLKKWTPNENGDAAAVAAVGVKLGDHVFYSFSSVVLHYRVNRGVNKLHILS